MEFVFIVINTDLPITCLDDLVSGISVCIGQESPSSVVLVLRPDPTHVAPPIFAFCTCTCMPSVLCAHAQSCREKEVAIKSDNIIHVELKLHNEATIAIG